MFPSDHKIAFGEEFASIIKDSEPLANDSIITFGIKPDSPNTGYGYISPSEKKLNGYSVESFKEKPTLDKAKEYINKGYYWNAGIFMFNSEVFCNEVKNLAPNIYSAFESSTNIDEAFSKIDKKVSIDYGIMVKSDKVAVVPVDIGWNDLGCFESFYDVLDSDSDMNISDDRNIMIDSSNTMIQSYDDKVVATVGVEDLIIIDNKDALLISKKSQSQKVKEVVSQLKDRKDSRCNSTIQDYRPWGGHYKILEEEEESFKIKRITVKQGKKLSYQLHYHRCEHWIVVKGMAKITVDDEVKLVRAGESIFFQRRSKAQTGESRQNTP